MQELQTNLELLLSQPHPSKLGRDRICQKTALQAGHSSQEKGREKNKGELCSINGNHDDAGMHCK